MKVLLLPYRVWPNPNAAAMWRIIACITVVVWVVGPVSSKRVLPLKKASAADDYQRSAALGDIGESDGQRLLNILQLGESVPLQ